MKIIPLSEGTFTIDKTKRFVPFDETADRLQERPVGSLLVEIQPFVVITSWDVLLLDTGLGFETNGVLQLHHNLMEHGINPGDVTKVLMSHLHKDHAGGVSFKHGMEVKPSFPNALYYVQRKEMEFALRTGSPSFIPEEIEFLTDHPQVEWLDGDGIIDGYIQYRLTGAHSPYHQAFWIREDNQTVFFGGDEAPQLGQLRHRFVAKYDADGKKAMEYRQQWWEQGEKENWTFLFYHDVKHPMYSHT